MGTIRLRFYEGVGVYALLTRLRTWGKYTHVDVMTPGGVLIGAEVDKGVTFHTTYEAKSHITLEVPVPNPELGLQWVRRQVGKPYDLGAIGGRSGWDDEATWFCSALAARTLIVSGLSLVFASPLFMASPQALLGAVYMVGARKVEND